VIYLDRNMILLLRNRRNNRSLPRLLPNGRPISRLLLILTPMSQPIPHSPSLLPLRAGICAALILTIFLPGTADAQERASPAQTPVVMDPFTVSTAGDVGYLAQSSLSGSRLNANLGDLAAPTTAFTAEFLEDTAVRSVDELSLYMPSTTITYPQANQAFFAGDSVQLKIRGLPALNYSVNYFATTLRLDLYNTTRVDQSRGANSILFGLGSPGGVVNIDTNRGDTDSTFGSITVQPRSWNGLRTAIDYNQALVPGKLALRVDAVRDHGGTWRDHEYDNQDRMYLAARWQVDRKTTVDVEFEHGTVDKSVGEPSTAADAYTIWANAGKNLATAANAAEGIQSIGTADYLVLNTTSGLTQDWKGKMKSVTNTLAGSTAYLTDFSILPKVASLAAGPAFPQETNYTREGLFIAHSFTPNLNFEVAADAHNAPRDTINGASFDTLYADPNATLPSGQPNPNAGQAYTEGSPVRNVYVDRTESLRVAGSYTHDFGRIFGKQQFAALWENDWRDQGNLQLGLYDVANPYSFASPENAANLIHYRTYLNLSGPAENLVSGDWQAYPINQLTESVSGRNIGAAWLNAAGGSAINRFNLETAMAVLQSHFLNDHLVTVAGLRNNWQDAWYSPTNIRGPATGSYVAGPLIVVPGSVDTPVRSHNATLSGVLHVLPWFGLTYNWATDFALPSTTGSTPYGRVSAPTGRSHDIGVKIDLGNRLSLNATYFQTSDHHDYQAATTLASNPDVYVNEIWSALAAAGVNAPNGGSALNQEVTSNGYTYDAVTKGCEFVLLANPTDDWRIYFTLTDSKTIDTSLGTESINYLAQNQSFWLQGNNGRVLLDGSGNLAPVAIPATPLTTVAQAVAQMQLLYTNFYTLGDGQRQLGQSPVQSAVRTDYAFSSGFLKGADIGGALRYLGGSVVDFVQPTPGSAAVVLYGPANALVDFNLGYQQPAKWFGHNYRWKIQLNINNALDQTRIIPMTVTATGQTIAYHLQMPREFILTTKLSF